MTLINFLMFDKALAFYTFISHFCLFFLFLALQEVFMSNFILFLLKITATNLKIDFLKMPVVNKAIPILVKNLVNLYWIPVLIKSEKTITRDIIRNIIPVISDTYSIFKVVNLYFSFNVNPSMCKLFLINSCSKTFTFSLL